MMRSALLSRAPVNSSFTRSPSPAPDAATPQQNMPTIRLISATPSATGSAADASASFSSAVAPFASSPLAPRTEVEAPRKKLVPKKSKLGLLGGGKAKDKASKDLSDVARRVVGGTASTGRGGFEIYVDQTEDPDIGEIVVVKKRKSRLGLDGMRWGALGEVTNVPAVPKEQRTASGPVEHLLKVKGDENQKWWSIGRGRKDSKGKEEKSEREKPQARSKTPDPVKSLDARARFNSLDSGCLLSSPITGTFKPDSISKALPPTPTLEPVRTDLLMPPTDSNGLLTANGTAPATGSIAIRAIRSMRSLARMTSWAQLKNDKDDADAAPEALTTKTTIKTKNKDKENGDAKKKKTKDKSKDTLKKKEKKEKEKTVRNSGSSFEAGALSAQGTPAPVKFGDSGKTLGRKRQSTLGLGLPSTLRLASMRNTSSTSISAPEKAATVARLSVDSAHLIRDASGRPTSIMSSGSSLRPPSTASGISGFSGRTGRSSSSSVVSVRWDEQVLQSTKEMQKKERRSRKEKEGRESRHTSDGRRRTPISEIFPETQLQRTGSTSPPESIAEHPIVTVEEATSDGHSEPDNDAERIAKADQSMPPTGTPSKRARPRPVSEQMLGRTRPKAVYDEDDCVLSVLDAATNELASLINRLDLEATPGSTNASPLKLSPFRNSQESPTKARLHSQLSSSIQQLRDSQASISSLRPYAQAQAQTLSGAPAFKQPFKADDLIGQPIAPWSSFEWNVSPKKTPAEKPVARLTHKRTLTPSPAIDPPPVFQPLRPAKTKVGPTTLASLTSGTATPPISGVDSAAAPSSLTFGSKPSKTGMKSSKGEEDVAPSPTPVFSKTHVKRGSSLKAISDKDHQQSPRHTDHGMPISREARKGLGLGGTMGGSTEPAIDPDDPDSDIPDELQVILSGQSDEDANDTLSFRHISPPRSPVSPLQMQLPLPEIPIGAPLVPELEGAPVFCAQLYDEEANQADIDDGGNGSSSEDDTTSKSFDFTGELQKLNESGASDRRSFVEQLENAFRTPARVDLGFELDGKLGFDAGLLVPPVPALPHAYRATPPEDVAPRSVTIPADESTYDLADQSHGISAFSDMAEFHLEGSAEDECRVYPELRSPVSMRSRASDGQLNVDFKFGGKPSIPDTVPEQQDRPLTLSDIIPPLSHSQSLLSHSRSASRSSRVEEDDSVLKSIMAKALDMPPPPVPRPRLDSDTSSKRRMRSSIVNNTFNSTSSHSRNTSELSFAGFESFEEVRRAFEFGPNRPGFYPPPGAASRPSHGREPSMFSIASISSYGAVLDSGEPDPFGYALSRPPSDDTMSIAMSMSVDDTFSFLKKDLRRQRVDSDASSFYFRMPSQASRRGHRRHESNMSTVSNGPPISMFNRSFAAHRRNDSNTSASSVAQSYAMHGAYGGRAAWARHRQDPSVDSMMSDISMGRLGRPGLGDKMFDNDYAMPLSAISASPPDSPDALSEIPQQQRNSWDSIIDGEPTRFSMVEDSLFDKTGYRASVSSDYSVFGRDDSGHGQLPSRQFRPLSMASIASIPHSPAKEDDTMITMLGGGHVRRRSIDSGIEGSPCARVERMKPRTRPLPSAALRFDLEEPVKTESPKVRLTEKPSIASTSSHQFGGERMIMARKGLLERQSLEDSALIAQGEDLLDSFRSRSVFSRPGPASRSRSSTCTSESSGAETPPLSVSDGSSLSSGSESSIDIGQLNALLANATHPSSGIAHARFRARARGTGHRRRMSQARASRSSVYDTILEESSVLSSPVRPPLSPTMEMSPVIDDSVVIVNGADSMMSEWDHEGGISTLRQYYALKDEAHETVTESKRVWSDTPFSIFALQSFQPPTNRGAMQAMLEHSQKNYGPLPYELRPHRIRSRTSSRASPYPLRNARLSMTFEQLLPSDIRQPSPPTEKLPLPPVPTGRNVLRDLSAAVNVDKKSPPPSLDAIKPFTPFSVNISPAEPKECKNEMGLPAPTRPRVTSTARRSALGWSKRSTGKSSSSDYKENTGSMVITPSETLRINRPRPRGRPTPARVPAPRA